MLYKGTIEKANTNAPTEISAMFFSVLRTFDSIYLIATLNMKPAYTAKAIRPMMIAVRRAFARP